LFATLSIPRPAGPIDPVLASAKREAVSCLVKFAMAFPDILVTLYDDFVSSMQPLLRGETLPLLEQQKLYEFLITLIHFSTVPTFEQKQKVFASVVSPMVATLTEIPLHHFETVEGAREMMGISFAAKHATLLKSTPALNQRGGEPVSSPELAEYLQLIKRRDEIISISMTCLLMMKRTSDSKKPEEGGANSLWIPYVETLIKANFLVAKGISLAYSPAFWEGVPVELRAVLDFSPQEKDSIMKRNILKPTLATEYERFIFRTRSWIVNGREDSFRWFLTQFKLPNYLFYQTIMSSKPLLEYLLPGAEYYCERHWKSLINILYLNFTHRDVLTNVLSLVRRKLEISWEDLARKSNGLANGGSTLQNGEESEIIADLVTRSLSRSFADFILKVVSCAFPDNPKTATDGMAEESEEAKLKASARRIEFIAALFETPIICEALFAALLSTLTFRDSSSCLKALVVFHRLVTGLSDASRPALGQYFGLTLLPATLRVFADGYFAECHNECVTLVTDIYLLCHPFCPEIRQVLLSVSDVTEFKMRAFEAEIRNKATAKEQHALVPISRLLKEEKSHSVPVAGESLIRPVIGRDLLDLDDGSDILAAAFDN
ncbi:hypothetical protein HDU96_002836, partial [Phlyctochytrium bullatum]